MDARALVVAVLGAAVAVPLAAGTPPARTVRLEGSANRPTALTVAGGTAVWGVTTRDGSVELRMLGPNGIRRLYGAKLPPAPPDEPSSFFRTKVVQEMVSLSSSANRVAFIRRASLLKIPRCGDATPPCLAPVQTEPLFAQVVVGTAEGRFRVVAAGDRRRQARCTALPTAVAVSGGNIVYSAEPASAPACPRLDGNVTRIMKVSVAGRRSAEVVAQLREARVSHVAYAGRFVAWSESREGRCPCAWVVRRDLATRRQVRLPQGNGVGAVALDRDGGFVFVGDVQRALGTLECRRAELAYVPVGGRRPRFLGRPAYALGGFARSRVVYVGGNADDCTGSNPTLLLQGVRGKARTLGPGAQVLAVAYDGKTLATATADGLDTVLRVEPLP